MPRRIVTRPGAEALDADALIAEASSKGEDRLPDLPPDAKAAVIKILAHNDKSSRLKRVTCDAVVEMLQARYGWQHGKDSFVRWVKRELGRKSWGEA